MPPPLFPFSDWFCSKLLKGTNELRQSYWLKRTLSSSKCVPGEWVKTCYIGEEGRIHKAAIVARERRNRLKWIKPLIQKLMEEV